MTAPKGFFTLAFSVETPWAPGVPDRAAARHLILTLDRLSVRSSLWFLCSIMPLIEVSPSYSLTKNCAHQNTLLYRSLEHAFASTGPASWTLLVRISGWMIGDIGYCERPSRAQRYVASTSCRRSTCVLIDVHPPVSAATVRVKCSPDDTVGDLKKLIAAQTGTDHTKIQLKKWCVLSRACHSFPTPSFPAHPSTFHQSTSR